MQTNDQGEHDHRADQVRSTGWAWRWVGWSSWPLSPLVLWVCAATVVIDVGTSWWGEPEWYLGRISMSPALPLGVLLLALIGPRHLGFSRPSLRAWREFLVLGGPLAVVWCISYPQSVAVWRDVEGVVIAVAGEELVYRLAAVVLIGAACAKVAGHNWRDTADWGTGPALGGLVGAGLVFSSLPGHVEQMTGAANLVPFLSLAVLLGYVALRSGSILPGFLVHLVIDLAALASFAGELSAPLRVLIDVGALVGVVLGLMLAGRRLGLRRRPPRHRSAQPCAVGHAKRPLTAGRWQPAYSPSSRRRPLRTTPGRATPNATTASQPCSQVSLTRNSAMRSQRPTGVTRAAPSSRWCTTRRTSTRSRSSLVRAVATLIPTP